MVSSGMISTITMNIEAVQQEELPAGADERERKTQEAIEELSKEIEKNTEESAQV